jgi:hypothetical protein
VFPDEVLTRSDDGWVMSGRAGERTFVGRRQEHGHIVARAEVEASDGVGGLEIRIDPDHAVTLEIEDEVARAVVRIGPAVSVLGEAAAPAGTVLELQTVSAGVPERSNERGPDQVVAVVVGPDGPVELARIDGRYLSTEVAGGFTGRMVGLVCARGRLVVRSFEYAGDEQD